MQHYLDQLPLMHFKTLKITTRATSVVTIKFDAPSHHEAGLLQDRALTAAQNSIQIYKSLAVWANSMNMNIYPLSML
jgi:hypothetical protein